MHQKIKEFAEQSNALYPNGYPSAEGGDAAWGNLVIFEKENLEKFAELIIKECAVVAMGYENYHGKILAHFGLGK